ncbi:hypothetical protein GALMADRAFT_227845 [Galerina marginata CBS 339.88]|uniref:Man(5)GlcNAc(2)-PP-dolichol translocation protein RFT1 n=1 Tax=Galerina marginata (strain CBS 339.88) TaxID=685588 RepID=A0A067SVQ0_GALM3|nr:hypothetical protein GALMADRAFT_227845 [Galerina marginata CBS 339.88]
MALQLLSRLFTFVLNQALFRLASPSAFGAAAIQFELILSTILFLSREGIRNALLRVGKDPSADSKAKRANLALLPIISGIPLALGTAVLYTRFAGEEIKLQPHFSTAIALYALAAVTELLSEPLYNVAMVELKTGIRVRAEGLGITAKSITTFLILFYDSMRGTGDLALLAFAFGQLVYGIVMFATYVVYLGGNYLRPKRPSSSGTTWLSYVDRDELQLSFTMTLQSLVKHFLTEGDKMILSWFSPLHDQGGYAIAVNYGSLIARIIFQPIEESLRVFFSRTVNTNTAASQNSKSSKSKSKASKPPTSSPPASQPLLQAASTLRSLLVTQTSLSLILVIFGSAYLPILLPLLLPRQYLSTSAPSVLAAWVWYIPVLAVNGGLEAFLSSVASPQELNSQSRWMIGFSLVYIVSAVLFYRTGLGDASLVYANIINLSVRIAYALRYTARFFDRSQDRQRPPIFHPRDALPSPVLLGVCALSALAIRMSARTLNADVIAASLGKTALFDRRVLAHVGVGSVLGVVCVGTWLVTSGWGLVRQVLPRGVIR